MNTVGELFALLAAFTWACALVLFKRGGDTLSPMALNLFKNLFSLCLLVVTVALTGSFLQPFSTLEQSDLWLLMASGVLGIAIADSFLFASLKRIGVTRTAIVDCLFSPSVLFCSWFLLGESIGWLHFAGASLIISGILFSALRKEPEVGPSTPRNELVIGVVYGVCAIVCMAVGIVMVKRILEGLPLLWSTTLRLLAGSVALALWLTITNRTALREAVTPNPSWKYLAPGAFLGTYVSMIFWIGGFKYANASVAGLLNQSTIIFAIPLSALFLKEHFSRNKVFAILLAGCGVALIAARPWITA
jgi:drug/metabolite transporter (DMT)-like permease